MEPGLAFKSCSKHGERHVGSLSTGSLSANAVDDDEEAARHVTMESIFVYVALATGIGLTCSEKCVDRSHLENRGAYALISILIRDFSPNVTRYDDSESGQQQIS